MSAYDTILKDVIKWQNEIEDTQEAGSYKDVLDLLAYLERVKFQPFLPALYSNRYSPNFMDRLHVWLNNPGLNEEDRRHLFRFAEHIAFFSFDDFAALFQHAFNGPITRWCIDQAGIRLTDSNWLDRLNLQRYQKTWFCPVTDSLLISLFHHVNEITDKERKPSFRDLAEFGDTKLVADHVNKHEFKRLVLLEDFVGTGTQAMKAIKWALKNLDIPLLFCPIIIGPEGVDSYVALKRKVEADTSGKYKCPSFRFEPLFKLGDDCFTYNNMAFNSLLFSKVSEVSRKIHSQLEELNLHCKRGPWGFCNENSTHRGATAVMFSNTPNNSLPLIWHAAENHWMPLFPRVARQPL